MCWSHKSDFLSYDFRLQRMKFKISKKPKKIYSGKRSWETKRWKRTWRTYINGLCSKWRRLTAKHGRASKEGLWIFSFLFFFLFLFLSLFLCLWSIGFKDTGTHAWLRRAQRWQEAQMRVWSRCTRAFIAFYGQWLAYPMQLIFIN